ncbi:hypothetical protein [Bradyrhizobium cosmicum]|nr:hypothetical protein [Bradyrhizobium cosmicum]
MLEMASSAARIEVALWLQKVQSNIDRQYVVVAGATVGRVE